MNVIRFNCPACQQSIEAPYSARQEGVVCPSCQTGFVPPDFKFVCGGEEVPAQEIEEVVYIPPRRHGMWELVVFASYMATTISIVSFIVALGMGLAGEEGALKAAIIAASFMVLAALLKSISLLAEIRDLLLDRFKDK